MTLDDGDIISILELVKQRRGLDYTGYSKGTLVRRLNLCLSRSGCSNISRYRWLLENSDAEMDRFLNTVLIPVSHFFRNPLVFEVLQKHVLRRLPEVTAQTEVSVWSAGCAGGEEAYSLAILFHAFAAEHKSYPPVKIYATDISKAGLFAAAAGKYSAEVVKEVKKGLLDSYFSRQGDNYTVIPKLREMVHFSNHDLLQGGAPTAAVFADFSLVFCRNVLIYYRPEVQRKIVGNLVDLLRPGGYLVLGEAETLPGDYCSRFNEIFPGTRIFNLKA